MTRRFLLWFSCALALALLSTAHRPAQAANLPSRLSDQEFWRIVSSFSESDGFFRSDNLTSNELKFQHVIPDLVARTTQGAVYLGVGPEQNFTYMASVHPAMAIIFDIRRGNMLLQLMYKALFEIASDRADFVAMLFSKARPASLRSSSSVADIFAAVGSAEASDAVYRKNLKVIEDRLTKVHRLPLTSDDLKGIEYVYNAFFTRGFAIRFSPTYADLMTATDQAGVGRGYLATESSFAFLKDLESKNLVVPVVGDFGGPKAIRAVAEYLKGHGGTISAFYLSNVEQYLYQDRKWAAFCKNVAALPLDESSTFIRSMGGGSGGFVSSLGQIVSEVKSCDAY